jgi:hypothetical protein
MLPHAEKQYLRLFVNGGVPNNIQRKRSLALAGFAAYYDLFGFV